MRYLLKKAKSPVEDADGALTEVGIKTVTKYAQEWVAKRARNMDLEMRFPELQGIFYDVRHDPNLAQEYIGKSIQNQRPRFVLRKAGGPFIGPRGGKWADPEHTISWHESEDAKHGNRYHYGAPYRPVSHATVPKGAEHQPHDAFKHGMAVYDQPLSSEQIKTYQLEPILNSGGVKNRINRTLDELHEYADAYREMLIDDPKTVEMTIRQSLERQGAGHFDMDAAVKQVIEELKQPLKKSGPYIGPRGGKWADPEHTIPWNPEQELGRKPADKPEATQKPEAPQREWVEDHPDFKGGKTTADKYRMSKEDEPIVYHPDRKPLHDKIIATFLQDRMGKPIPPPPPGVKKTAIVTMGGPASGKTSTLKTLLGVPDGDFATKGYVNVNPDDVKEHLPEYRQGLNFQQGDKKVSARNAATVVHEESSDVAGEIQQVALERGLNVIVDGTGKNADKHQRLIKNLQDKGYHVKVVMPHLDKEEAQKRALARAEHSGRYVPKSLIDLAYNVVPQNFERIARAADEFHMFDTGGDKGAVLKWSGGKGQADIEHDPRFVQQFKAHAKLLSRGGGEGMTKSERFIIKAFPPKLNNTQAGPTLTIGQKQPPVNMPPKPNLSPTNAPQMPQAAPQAPQTKPPMPGPSPTPNQPPSGQPGAPGGQNQVGERPAITMDEIIANTKQFAGKIPIDGADGKPPKFPGAGTIPGVGVNWPMSDLDFSPHRISYYDPKAKKEKDSEQKPEASESKK